jgi:transposase-like protein
LDAVGVEPRPGGPRRSGDRVRRSFQDGPLNRQEIELGERKYRSWTAKQKLEIVLAGLKGDRSVRDVCREQGISETLYYGWRDKLFEAGLTTLAGKEERQRERELRKRIGQLELPPRRIEELVRLPIAGRQHLGQVRRARLRDRSFSGRDRLHL